MLLLLLTKYLALAVAVAGIALAIDPRLIHVGAAVISLELVNTLLVCFISVLVVVIAAYSQRNLLGQAGLTRYSLSLLTAFAGLIVMVTAGTLTQFAIGWTVSGQATVFLVAHAASATAHRASRYVRTWLLVSDVLVWLAVIAAAVPTSLTLNIDAINFSGSATGAFLVAACIARTGLVPAHRWLAQTAEAPSPVSAFLHAGIINAAGITVVLWLPEMRAWLPVLLLSACASIVVGLWTINDRTDVKGKLASSTTTQMAFMSIEAAVGLPGLALLHLFGHGGYKSWCFLRAGGAITRSRLGRRPVTRSYSLLALSALLAVITLTVVWLLLGQIEILSTAVAAVACIGVIYTAGGSSPRVISAIAAISSLAFAGYLVLVHAWLAWLPVVHWQDNTLVAVALASLAIGAFGLKALPRHSVHRITWFLMAPRWLRRAPSSTLSLPPAVDDIYATELVSLDELVDIASGCAAPTWPLRTAVAINPVQSLTGMSFAQAGMTAGTWGAALYPSASHYLSLLESGDIALVDLERAAGGQLAAAELIERTEAVAAEHSHTIDTAPSTAQETANRWCQLSWSDSQTAGDCFALWHQGLPSRIAQQISSKPIVALHQAIAAHLGTQALGESAINDSTGAELRFLNSLLAQAPGWAAHAHWRGHDELVQLLALRACLCVLNSDEPNASMIPTFNGADVWQQALEATFDAWLTPRIGAPTSVKESKPVIGVVSCIDVRSEPMRRALERSTSVRTFGMAGFFGVAARLHINNTTIDLAPVILKPSAQVDAIERTSVIRELAASVDYTMRGVGGLAIAEGYGLGALAASVLNTFAPRLSTRLARAKNPDLWLGTTGLDVAALPLATQVNYARGFLDSLGTELLPSLLVVAGHSADAANNAFAAAYQCGACGGNTGTVNARMIATMLNAPSVRTQLIADGYDLAGTHFVAAIHNTTTQEMIVDPAAEIPASHQEFAAELMRASSDAHNWLSDSPTSLPGPASPSRGLDWAQPFPEWGLVGNAACVIGPRALTAESDLGGRVFLHEYDWTLDPNGAVLRNILEGPGVVMHMINMQYFCSTTDPHSFGSGDKTRHNIVGDTGVLIGASGDLHYGLPWQSLGPTPLHSLHVPIRLRLHIAAPDELLATALAGTTVEQLAAHGWLNITSISTQTTLQPVEAR